ncbi:MAG: diaminopimelate epimerase, partial [Vulcanimicrobiaceae bacterium]
TDAGIIETRVIARQPEYLVRVMMGVPHIEPRPLPVGEAVFVDMGNPHVVAVRDADVPFDIAAIGASFQRESVFPGGANVHHVVVEASGALRVRHYERGAGLTMACGTGAVASAAVAIWRGLVRSPVEVLVPGGRLLVEWDGAGAAYLTGPAVRVFDTVL